MRYIVQIMREREPMCVYDSVSQYSEYHRRHYVLAQTFLNQSASHLDTTNMILDPTMSVPSASAKDTIRHKYGPSSL